MSFFKDFKADLSQAVNELLPDETPSRDIMSEEPQMVDTITDDDKTMEDLASMLDKMGGEQAPEVEAPVFEPEVELVMPDLSVFDTAPEPTPIVEPVVEPVVLEAAPEVEVAPAVVEVAPVAEEAAPVAEEAPVEPEPEPETVVPEPVEEKVPVTPIFSQETRRSAPINTTMEDFSMETGIIIAGMSIKGDVTSDGSLDLRGNVTGNINIKGKLEVTGTIEGNSYAEEVFADGAEIVGEVHANGSVKVGEGTVVKGNISASSAVLAGAVKGDIDVQGPVILDSTAIIMGNIKSKSIQINNGAVIEGLCSQCYADVSPMSFFGDDKKAK